MKVNSHGEFETKAGDTIPFLDVTNLRTGEEQRMWIDGGLKGTFSQLGGNAGVVGLALEITRGPQKAIDMNGEKVKVNTYEVFKLEDA